MAAADDRYASAGDLPATLTNRDIQSTVCSLLSDYTFGTHIARNPRIPVHDWMCSETCANEEHLPFFHDVVVPMQPTMHPSSFTEERNREMHRQDFPRHFGTMSQAAFEDNYSSKTPWHRNIADTIASGFKKFAILEFLSGYGEEPIFFRGRPIHLTKASHLTEYLRDMVATFELHRTNPQFAAVAHRFGYLIKAEAPLETRYKLAVHANKLFWEAAKNNCVPVGEAVTFFYPQYKHMSGVYDNLLTQTYVFTKQGAGSTLHDFLRFCHKAEIPITSREKLLLIISQVYGKLGRELWPFTEADFKNVPGIESHITNQPTASYFHKKCPQGFMEKAGDIFHEAIIHQHIAVANYIIRHFRPIAMNVLTTEFLLEGVKDNAWKSFEKVIFKHDLLTYERLLELKRRLPRGLAKNRQRALDLCVEQFKAKRKIHRSIQRREKKEAEEEKKATAAATAAAAAVPPAPAPEVAAMALEPDSHKRKREEADVNEDMPEHDAKRAHVDLS